MPLKRGQDSKGAYYKWGEAGHKYHYTAGNAASRTRAKNKALRQGRAVEASVSRRSAPGRKTGGKSHHWITRPGKLGGPGYLRRPAAARHKILDGCVKKYGYVSCLDSLMVLNRNREIKQLHGKEIDSDKRYLEKKYSPVKATRRRAARGGAVRRRAKPASSRPRAKPKPKRPAGAARRGRPRGRRAKPISSRAKAQAKLADRRRVRRSAGRRRAAPGYAVRR